MKKTEFSWQEEAKKDLFFWLEETEIFWREYFKEEYLDGRLEIMEIAKQYLETKWPTPHDFITAMYAVIKKEKSDKANGMQDGIEAIYIQYLYLYQDDVD